MVGLRSSPSCCENYCIFYLYSEEDVIVVRILHQRQDSLKALFMDN